MKNNTYETLKDVANDNIGHTNDFLLFTSNYASFIIFYN